MPERKNPGRKGPRITSAGMRRDATRGDNNAAIPSEDSLIEEIEWRKEHTQ